ncbi:hypothetical protein [Pseudomonas sp. GM18]|uniref:hypothetical protein n=1 Tax=Pseudomonas sp. GM18 TaxID=1144324 RepID=UPI0012FC8128|nr:hypothetical protein [Pseudomonas sp. GM18]
MERGLETFFKSKNKFPEFDLITHLFKSNQDENWVIAQCQSIEHQLKRLIHDNAYTLEPEKISRELITDISIFNQHHKVFSWDVGIHAQNYLTSMEAFLNAKFSYANYVPASTSGRTFKVISTPAQIRFAIEFKIKNMLRILDHTYSDGSSSIIQISELLNFCEKNSHLFTFPISITALKELNKWSNNFIHSGVFSYYWQSLQAIEIIEPMFSIKDSKSIHLEGFNYLAPGIESPALKEELEKHFNHKKKKTMTFHICDTPLEGRTFAA